MSRTIACGIARCGGMVASGLTRGIDAAAAEGALYGGGVVIGVLGTCHANNESALAAEVAGRGALISEYAPYTETRRLHFRERNRITSGISVGVVAVEAPEGSDSVMLKEKNLHAWVEVYIGQYGWVTFDPTSSSVYSSTGTRPAEAPESTSSVISSETSDELISTEVSSAESSSEVSSAETADTTSPDTAENNGISFRDVLPYIIIMLAAAALAAVIAYCVHFCKKLGRRAEAALYDMSVGRVESMLIYEKLLSVAELMGVSPKNGELPADFFERIDKTFGTGLCNIVDELESVAFGGADDHRGTLAYQLDIMYRNVCAHSYILRKIKLRRLICQK